MGGNDLYNRFVSDVVVPDISHLELSFKEDWTLHLPKSFAQIDSTSVRFLTAEDVASVLREYEEILRSQLAQPSKLDRFVNVPEGEHAADHPLRAFNLLRPPSWCLPVG